MAGLMLRSAAVAGFRIVNHLAWGNTLYCDDLGTRYEHRKQGFAGQLMDWMIEEAQRLHCDEFHLDSGVGPDREDAHRLYQACGYRHDWQTRELHDLSNTIELHYARILSQPAPIIGP